jgi:D-alanyl-D-alanine carboxypeptidase
MQQSMWANRFLAMAAAACLLAACGDDGSGGAGAGGTGGAGGGMGGVGGSGGVAVDPCVALGEALQVALDASLAEEARIGGTVAAVLTPDCRWIGATGESETGVPLAPDALMRIGSITKTYVSAAVVSLATQGALSLDDTLDTWVLGVPNGDAITVRQLLNHTGGVYNYTNDQAFMIQALSNPDVPVAPQEMVDVAIAHGAVFDPGANWDYSNTGYILLGMILEQVTGMGSGAHLRSALFDPVGLDRTFFDGEETVPDGLAKGWDLQDQDATYALHPTVPWTAGVVVADAGDLVDWADALYDGDAVDADTLSQILTFIDTGASEYGLGVARTTLPLEGGGSAVVIGHGGGIPGYYSNMFYLPDHDVAIATVVNSNNGDPNVSFRALANVALAGASP